MLAKPGQMSGPNWLKHFEGTYIYPLGNIRLKNEFVSREIFFQNIFDFLKISRQLVINKTYTPVKFPFLYSQGKTMTGHKQWITSVSWEPLHLATAGVCR